MNDLTEKIRIVLVDQVRDKWDQWVEEAQQVVAYQNTLIRYYCTLREAAGFSYDANGNLTEEAGRIDTLSGQKEPDGIEVKIKVEKSRVYG